MHIGSIPLPNRLFAAPMAGVTDRPFRQLCKRLGAGYAVSEMVTSRRDLWQTLKTSRRADHTGEPAPIQLAERLVSGRAIDYPEAELFTAADKDRNAVDLALEALAEPVQPAANQAGQQATTH